MTTLFDIKAHKGDIGGSTYTPYKFNGKERDDETGYYYYGARYYDPGTALWFGVDPLADVYPMYGPYVYCCASPVIATDENGEWVNYVVGAVLGTIVEYSTQVAQNLIENPYNIMGSLTENIDVFDIAVAAVEGAATSGGSVVEKTGAKAAIGIGAEVLSNTFDVQTTADGIKTKINRAKDVVMETIVGSIVSKITSSKFVKKFTDKISPQIDIKSNNKTTKNILNSKNITNREARKEALYKTSQRDINQTLKNASNNTATHIGKKSVNGALKEDN